MNGLDGMVAALWRALQDGPASPELLLQLGTLVAAGLVAWLLARRTARWIEQRFPRHDSQAAPRFAISWRELLSLVFAVVLLWGATAALAHAGLHANFVRVAANLATAWAVIRATSSTIRSSFWSRLTALVLWLVAGLNILGWLAPVVAFMDGAAVTVGTARISLLAVVKGLVALVVLFWLVTLLSASLERTVARASGLNPSQRVLFTKLGNIVLLALAALVGLNIVGLDLTALAVFSGALGLGIGFGLQKVFSNLISGIILLLDKSVKPGDVIAVGNTYGWVNALGARCVSVLTRDGKEHLIPNENLMSQQVENWSYSNKTIRVHVPIGVAYGSDVHRVREVLISAADGHPRILAAPKPACLITGFGDSAIEYELRVWIETPEDGVTNIRSDLYYRIWDLFKEHQIAIPFPQRDLHIRSGLESLTAGVNLPAHGST